MEEMIRIRKEEESDYEQVEKITRQAFWNLYVPGCVEHYLVHVMRSHEDFLPELDLVIEVEWSGHREYHVHKGKTGG